jgi:hypothetical protein
MVRLRVKLRVRVRGYGLEGRNAVLYVVNMTTRPAEGTGAVLNDDVYLIDCNSIRVKSILHLCRREII